MKKIILFIILCLFFHGYIISQWKPTKGPYGGNIRAFHEFNQRLYAGTDNGLFVSSDQAESWSFINIGFQASITSLADMNGRLFAGTDGSGILCSSDNGSSWQRLSSGLSTYYRFCGYCITGFSVAGNVIYTATGDGLYMLQNNDTSWTFVANGQFDTFEGDGIHMIYSQTVRYGPGSMCKITNDGASFHATSFPGPLSYDRDLATSLSISSSGLYAVSHNDLLFSADDGNSWASIYNDSAAARPVMVKAIGDKVYLATAGNGLLVSTTGTNAWTNAGLPQRMINTIYRSGDHLFAGTDHSRGVYISDAINYNWVEKNNNLSAMKVSSFADHKNIMVAGCRGGVLVSRDTGFTWRRIDLHFQGKPADNENEFNVEKVATNGKIILAGCSQGPEHAVFTSLDSGNTWHEMNQPFDTPLAGLAIAGNRLVVCTWFELYYSDDSGGSWNQGQPPAGNDLCNDMSASGNKLFIASFNHIYYSADSAETWNMLPPASSPLNFYISPEDSLLFVTTSNGLFSGPADGSNWMQAYPADANGYTSDYLLGICKNHVFIADRKLSEGFKHSYDYGHTWANEMVFGNYRTQQMGRSDYYVYASTPGFGIWRYKADEHVEGIETMEEPNFTVFPNPSSGAFTLQLQKQGKAVICVYDLLGNCILDRMQMQGLTETIDLTNKAKGLYFIEVKIDNKKLAAKVAVN